MGGRLSGVDRVSPESCSTSSDARCEAGMYLKGTSTVWQAVCARPSACRASRHAAWMQVSAVRQWEHACSSTSAALALGVATQPGVHPRGTVSVPRSRSTSAAISQQPVGRFPPKFKTTQLVTRARWPWRSAPATRGHADLHRSLKQHAKRVDRSDPAWLFSPLGRGGL